LGSTLKRAIEILAPGKPALKALAYLAAAKPDKSPINRAEWSNPNAQSKAAL